MIGGSSANWRAISYLLNRRLSQWEGDKKRANEPLTERLAHFLHRRWIAYETQ